MKRTAFLLAFAAAVAAQPLSARAAPRIAHQPSTSRPFGAAVQVGDTYWCSGKIVATAEISFVAGKR